MARSIAVQRLGGLAARTSQSLTLNGLQVLIVEDDYYLAMESKAVLEDAGAEVIGPFPTFELVEKALDKQRPDCAVVDINLGAGPSFATAQRLQADEVPFIFLTGYSAEVIPAQFWQIPHTQKPAHPQALVQALQNLST